MVAQDSVLANRIGWVVIGMFLSMILAAFLTNFLILPEVEDFIDLLCISGICSDHQGMGTRMCSTEGRV